MPFVLTWVDPEVVLTYKSVTVYHAYDDDPVPEDYLSPIEYHYTLDETEGERFDIRDLPEPPAVKEALKNGEVPEDIELQILRYAIELGILTPDGINQIKFKEFSSEPIINWWGE